MRRRGIPYEIVGFPAVIKLQRFVRPFVRRVGSAIVGHLRVATHIHHDVWLCRVGADGHNPPYTEISLSTTSADWNTISSTFASNIGANNTQVFLGNLAQPWAFGDTLILNFSTPFTYNPALGNLLMDVHVSGTSDSNADVYLDTNGFALGALGGNAIMGRVYSGGIVNKGYGLVTDFTTGATAAPEPSFAFPLGVGLGLLGIANVLRLNRRAASDRAVIA